MKQNTGMRLMQLIEFVGAPGVGKSTIHRLLVRRLHQGRRQYLTQEEALTIAARRNIEKILRYCLKVLPFKYAVKLNTFLDNRSYMYLEAQSRFLANWGKSFEVFLNSFEFSQMKPAERALVIASFLEVGACFECLIDQLPDRSVVVQEEGFIQKSFMFISPLQTVQEEESILTRYLANIPIPEVVVYVFADVEACYERMVSRSEGLTKRLDGKSKAGVLHFLENSIAHLQRCLQWLRIKEKSIVIEVDNNLILEDVVAELEKKIKAIYF